MFHNYRTTIMWTFLKKLKNKQHLCLHLLPNRGYQVLSGIWKAYKANYTPGWWRLCNDVGNVFTAHWPRASLATMYLQHDDAPCHKINVVSNWFHEHDTEFSSSVAFPVTSSENLWDVVRQDIRSMKVHLKNVQELHDAIMSTWTWIKNWDYFES